MKRRKASRRSPSVSPRAHTARVGRHLASFLASWAPRVCMGILLAWPPFLIVTVAKDSFRLPKLMACETWALASLVVLAAFRLWHTDRFHPRRLLTHPAILFAMPLFVAAMASLATSDHTERGLRALASLGIGLLGLVGWSLGLREHEFRRLLDFVLVPVATLLATFALLQFFDIYDPFGFRELTTDRFTVISVAGNASDLAAYLLVPTLYLQARVLAFWARGQRAWLRLGLLALCAAGILVTQALSVLLALAIASPVLWILIRPPRRIVVATLATLVLVGGLAGVAAMSLDSLTEMRRRIEVKATSLVQGDVEQILTGRTDAWKAALWMARQQPLLGLGHGAFYAEFGRAKLALAAEGAEFFPGHRLPYFENAHSEPLEVAAEWGLIGLLAILVSCAILSRVLRNRWRARSGDALEDPEHNPEARRAEIAMMIAATLALGIVALFNFPFRVGVVAYSALFLFAWILRGPEGGKEEARAPAAAWGSRRLGALSIAAVLVLGGLLIVQQQAADRRLQSSRILQSVEGAIRGLLSSENQSAAVLRRRSARALSRLQQAAELDPLEVGIPIARSALHLNLRNPRAAVEDLQQAGRMVPREMVFINLGYAYEELGDNAKAEEAFKAAETLFPGWKKRLNATGVETPER